MSAKQNRIPGWREDFLQWERSGAPANDMLWEKLQTRLEPRKRKTMIYLLPAAAVLLLVIGLSYLFFIRDKSTGNNTATATPRSIIKPKAPAIKSPVVAANPTKELLPLHGNNQQKKLASGAKKEQALTLIPEKKNLPEFIEPTEQIQLAPDTLKPIIAEAPKKKLKVVHMNEWNAPPPPTYATIKEAWEREAKRMQQEDDTRDQTTPHKRWSIFSPRN